MPSSPNGAHATGDIQARDTCYHPGSVRLVRCENIPTLPASDWSAENMLSSTLRNVDQLELTLLDTIVDLCPTSIEPVCTVLSNRRDRPVLGDQLQGIREHIPGVGTNHRGVEGIFQELETRRDRPGSRALVGGQ
eukprot:8444141-Pyramimonas_sp.AAC.1